MDENKKEATGYVIVFQGMYLRTTDEGLDEFRPRLTSASIWARLDWARDYARNFPGASIQVVTLTLGEVLP